MHGTPHSPGPVPDVLLVDDDPVSVAAISGVLSASGFSVASVPSGESAVRAAPGLRPRLLILDVSMPGMDGYSVCREIRAHPATADVPILFLSSTASLDDRLSGLRAGGMDFLAKPCDQRELLALVRAHLRAAETRETLSAHNRELATINSTFRSGLTAASRVQMAMLPQECPAEDGLSFGWRCVPCEQLGGDMLNIFRTGPGRYAVSILDASGHGIPAALLAVSSSHIVSAMVGSVLDAGARRPTPASILQGLNQVLARQRPGGMFVTALVGTIDATTRRFSFAAAGHPGPLLLRANGESSFLDEGGPPAGLATGAYADYEHALAPGDRVLLYSDGVYDQAAETGERFGRERLREHALRVRDRPPVEIVHSLIDAIEQWRASRPISDDLSLLAFALDAAEGDPGRNVSADLQLGRSSNLRRPAGSP